MKLHTLINIHILLHDYLQDSAVAFREMAFREMETKRDLLFS